MPTVTAPEPSDVMPMTAVRTLERSFHRAVAGGGLVWQFFMIVAVLTAPVRVPSAVLVGAHLLLAVLAGITLWRAADSIPLVLGIYLVGFVDLAAAASPAGPVTFGAMWCLSVVAATPVFIMSRLRAVALGSLVLGVAVIELGLVHPDWPASVAAFTVATTVTLMVAAQVLMSWIRSAAERADETTLGEQQVRHRERVTALVGREIDEDARLLHDTLINTLGAVASGRGATRDPQAVRERCARDAAVVAALMADEHPEVPGGGLADVGDSESGIAVVLEIPPERVLGRFEEMMPAAVRQALVTGTREAIRNAAKHSGADRVTVTIALAGPDIAVRVRDHGIGFDPAEAITAHRGIVHSIQRRCEDAEIDVTIDSEPGRGSTVSFAWSMVESSPSDGPGPAESPSSDSGVSAELDVVTNTVTWAWAAFVLVSALVTTRVSPPVPGHLTDLASGLVAVLCAGAWAVSRNGRTLPRWAAVVVALGVPFAFGLSYAGVHVGAIPLVTMQSLVVTPLLVILILRVRSRTPLLLSLTGLAVVVIILASLAAEEGTGQVLDPLIAAGPLVTLGGCWVAFVPMLTRIVTQRATARQGAFEAETAMAVREAVRATRTRWVDAGVKEAADVLGAVAAGDLDPLDPQVQRRCGEIEHHIRALLAIDTELVHVGPWLAAALLRARSRTILARIVGGTVDAPDSDAAAELGRMLLTVLSLCPEQSRVVIGIFGEPQDPVFSLVGPAELSERVTVDEGVRWQVTSALHDNHWRAEARLR